MDEPLMEMFYRPEFRQRVYLLSVTISNTLTSKVLKHTFPAASRLGDLPPTLRDMVKSIGAAKMLAYCRANALTADDDMDFLFKFDTMGYRFYAEVSAWDVLAVVDPNHQGSI